MNAALVYKSHQLVPADQFKTREFTNVANEFNSLNSEIIVHQKQLQEKNLQLLALNDEIESTLRETVYTMGVIKEQRSKETAHHTKRVSLYSQLLAQKLGLDEDQVNLIAAAAPLHDIDKLGVPDAILFKPGSLDDEGRKVMENHPKIGHEMLKHSERDILITAATIAYQQHEK